MRSLSEQFALAGDALSLGLVVAALVLAPAGIGLAVDRALGTSPWAALAGGVIGVVVASVGVTRLVLRRYARLAPPGPKEDR